MDSPRKPPYEVSELEQWLEGETIYKNPGSKDPGLMDPIMLRPDFDFYSAEKWWGDGRVTVVMARKHLFIPRSGSFWHRLDLKNVIIKPYFTWAATFDTGSWSEIEDEEARQRAYNEREGFGYDHAPSKKIFKMMKRLYNAQK